jgi:hypothetical protein
VIGLPSTNHESLDLITLLLNIILKIKVSHKM